jgi:hypothetical protein
MKKLEENELERGIRAWIGIDWADEKHDVSVYDVASGKQEALVIRQTPEALQEWFGQLRSRYTDGYVAVVLEQGRGGLLNALMGCEFLVLYIINPKSLSSFREAFYGSGATSDPVDAELMRDMVRQNPSRFRAWRPDDVLTRSLRLLTEGRRDLESVDGTDESAHRFVERILSASLDVDRSAGYDVGVRISGTMADIAKLASQQPPTDPSFLSATCSNIGGSKSTVETNPRGAGPDTG